MERPGIVTGSALACSVIIPTLNEAAELPQLLDDLHAVSRVDEIVVSDGGSVDGTLDIARTAGAVVVSGPPGRGRQLRAGARAATKPWLVFLHADTRMGGKAAAALDRFVETAPARTYAHFRLTFDTRGAFYRFIEFGQRIRERLLGMPYGDQGLIVSRTLYDHVGGFPDWPIMEDVEVIDRLAGHGRRLALDAELVTSGRRYRREGPVRAGLRNLVLIVAFRLGADPAALSARYRPERPDPRVVSTPHRAYTGRRPGTLNVVVFAKAPVEGRVKTRLAADLGAEHATRIYRALGRQTVDALRDGPWSTTVHVEPPDHDSIAAVKRWLGEGVGYRGQTAGDLGARMIAAIDEALLSADRVCVVGTDILDLDTVLLGAAFDALDHHDVVIGPATDGGYYLIGMSRPHPEIFHAIPWSTELVLRRTLNRLHEAGLSVAMLPPRRDIDTIDDVPAALLGV